MQLIIILDLLTFHGAIFSDAPLTDRIITAVFVTVVTALCWVIRKELKYNKELKEQIKRESK